MEVKVTPLAVPARAMPTSQDWSLLLDSDMLPGSHKTSLLYKHEFFHQLKQPDGGVLPQGNFYQERELL